MNDSKEAFGIIQLIQMVIFVSTKLNDEYNVNCT